jgi:hypothetical protein
MNNTCPTRVTAAAGTNLAGTFPFFTIIIFKKDPELTDNFISLSFIFHGGLLDHTQYALSNILYCSQKVQATISSPLWLIVR